MAAAAAAPSAKLAARAEREEVEYGPVVGAVTAVADKGACTEAAGVDTAGCEEGPVIGPGTNTAGSTSFPPAPGAGATWQACCPPPGPPLLLVRGPL